MAERLHPYFGFYRGIILNQLAQCLTIDVVAKERPAVLAEPDRTQPRADIGLGGIKAVAERNSQLFAQARSLAVCNDDGAWVKRTWVVAATASVSVVWPARPPNPAQMAPCLIGPAQVLQL